jgi:aryl-alcohol dehydrogenase-like predicted oxidoreductase
MQFRQFGRTGLQVSEAGFGAWAIGGQSFGDVSEQDALRALASAEDLGCNFVDTAAVYGESEARLGRFLKGRRDRWILASKYSGQDIGMTALLDQQLGRLGTDYIDYYQLHFLPPRDDDPLYAELESLKRDGKVRFIGVSLYSEGDLDRFLADERLDGLQIKLSLLDPRPLLDRLERIRVRAPAVIARSCLKDGFLTGKWGADARFDDPHDQRSRWSREQVAASAGAAERFRFLEDEAGTMTAGAIRYALSFPEVSTVILSAKNAEQAAVNFTAGDAGPLDTATLARIRRVQGELELFTDSLPTRLRRLARKVRRFVRR